MLWFFFDTSAIVKRYHKEKGDEIVDRITDSILEGSHKGIISALVILEFVSASRKKVNARELTWTEFVEGVTSFYREATQHFVLQSVDSSMYADAIDFVIRYALSSSDSVHLVSLNRIPETVDKSKVIFVSADKKLCDSAEQEGFRTLNPEQASADRVDKMLKE